MKKARTRRDYCHRFVLEDAGTALDTITIVLGFSVLALSQFLPTIYFGLLTGLAMIVALVADLTLLPLLLARFRAFQA